MSAGRTTSPITLNPRRWWALAAIVLSGLVIAIDLTVLITALPTLAVDLRATTSDLQWFSDAYTLTLGGLLLPAGMLGDRYGRKRLLIIGLLLFGLASVGASFTTSPGELIAMRALMGVGGAIVTPLSLSILPVLFIPEERTRAVALASVGAFLGLPLGPLAAGWLLTHFDWGSIFLINAPLIALALIGVVAFVPESRDSNPKRLDWIGTVLVVVGVTALVYGIIQEPQNGWGSAVVIRSLIGGTLALVIFGVRDLRTAEPLVDLRLFRDPRFAWATAAFAIAAFALAGALFTLTPFMQIVEGVNAQQTGLRLLPLIATLVAGGLAGSRIAALIGRKLIVSTGLFVTAGGLIVLAAVGVGTSYTVVLIGLAATGLGMGLSMPTALDMVLESLPADETGAGTALARTGQQLGSSFGVAVLGSVLNSGYRTSLDRALPKSLDPVRAAADRNLGSAIAAANTLSARSAATLVRVTDHAYAVGMSHGLLACAAVLACGAVTMLVFLPNSASENPRPAEAIARPIPQHNEA
jgi:MFS transporter, DHA2 family, multidrug resistance protein